MVKITVTEAEERRCGLDGNKEASSFERLPEGCIANVLSFTTPWEACALSSVSSTFRSAAQSDVVWERFLPSDYRHILSQSSAPLIFASKRDLYLHLCQKPLLIDAGKMSFALDKLCGKKCYMLSARFLSIVWGDTPRFWRWTSTPYSRFGEVAELVSVCWLEIRGRMKTCMLSADTLYGAYLVFKDRDGGAHGFQYRQVEASVGIVGEGDAPPPPSRTVCLDTLRLSRPSVNVVISRRLRRMSNRNRYRPRFGVLDEQSPAPMFVNPSGVGIEYPRQRSDGWWEVELGDFFNNEGGGDKGREVEMAVYEINSGDWKGGLVLQGIELRPKHDYDYSFDRKNDYHYSN